MLIGDTKMSPEVVGGLCQYTTPVDGCVPVTVPSIIFLFRFSALVGYGPAYGSVPTAIPA